LVSSYLRAVGLPSRIIYYDAEVSTDDHYTAEVWVNNRWVPIDVDDHYDWFDDINKIHQMYPADPEPHEPEIVNLWVILEFQSSSSYISVNLNTFDPDQYDWYEANVWPYLP